MAAVDNLKRLCIDHYLEEEIESAMGVAMDLVRSDDLLDATLSFRLMREISLTHRSMCVADDVLRRFTNSGGEFSVALTQDILGLLSLHDMSHLNIGEEASLHKAKEFSTKHLASAIRNLEPSLALYVRQSLDHPYHLSLMQGTTSDTCRACLAAGTLLQWRSWLLQSSSLTNCVGHQCRRGRCGVDSRFWLAPGLLRTDRR